MSIKGYVLIIIAILMIYTSCICGCITNEKKNNLEKVSIYFNEEHHSTNIFTNYTREGETTIITLVIDVQNLTRIDFNLSWTDDKSGWHGDEFNLSIKSPEEALVYFIPSNSIQLEEFKGNIQIITMVNTIPENMTIEENQLETYLEKKNTNNGGGIWEIEITCINAYYEGDIGPIITHKDYGNDWNLTVSKFNYKAYWLSEKQ